MSSGADPELVRRIRTALAEEAGVPSVDRVAAAARATGAVLGDLGLLEMVDAVRADLTGAGPLEELLADPDVTDLVVNGATGVWVDRGSGLERRHVDVGTADDVRRLAVRLAATAGRRLDDASPWVDARLPDGTRLHAVLPPVVHGGPHLSLRLPRRVALSFADLVRAGTVPEHWEPVVAAVIAAKAAFLVTGGTGTGKTTLLAALLALVPPLERLVVVEDAAELWVDHPHVVRLEGRPANIEGAGQVSMTDLVRQALRMRPDRLVVGEVRGAEVRELLAALNTGHEGGCGTVHANASTDLPPRLEALGALAGLDRAAVQAQAAAAVEVVVHMRRLGSARHIAEIAVVRRHGAELEVVPALARPHGDARPPVVGPGWSQLAQRLRLAVDAVPGGG
ncbi:MAG: TadA family conjugal transfer-associated ATPase [Actinomycetales bacterium]